MPASATGRGAQVVLTEAQRQVARGVYAPTLDGNIAKQQADQASGSTPLGSSPDGTTLTGLPAIDLVTTGISSALAAAAVGATPAPNWPTQDGVTSFVWSTIPANTPLESISGWVKRGTGSGVQTDGTYLTIPITATADTIWTYNTGTRIHYIEATLNDFTNAGFPLCVRAIDQDNFIGLRINGSTTKVEVYQRVAATFTSLASITYGANPNAYQTTYRLEATGDDRVRLYANGNLIGSYAIPAALTNATSVGLSLRTGNITLCHVGDLHIYAGQVIHGVSGGANWCWFAEPRSITASGKTWTAYASMNAHINDNVAGATKITQIDNVTGAVVEYVLRDSVVFADDHSNPSIAIRPDGRLVCFYSGHIDSAGWRFRISVNAYDASAWSQEYLVDATDAATNPVCYICGNFLSADANRCYVFFRQGAGVGTAQTWLSYMVSADLNSVGAAASDGAALGGTPTWSANPLKVMVTNGTKGVYFKPWSNGVDRIDFFITDAIAGDHREKDDVRHFYMRSAALFFTSAGQSISVASPATISAATPIATSLAPDNFGDVWVWDGYRDATTGELFCVFVRFISQYLHQYYYARWDGSRWLKWPIPGAVSGPLSQYASTGTFGDDISSFGETYYSPGICLDSGQRGVVYVSVSLDGSTPNVQPQTAEMRRYVTLDDGATWSYQVISPDNIRGARYSGKNYRPVVPRAFSTAGIVGGRDRRVAVFWMRGSYDFFSPQPNVNNFGWHTELMYSRF